MSVKTNKILLMGPISPPYTGQSVAFTTVYNALNLKDDIILINISNKETILSGILLCFKILFVVLSNKIDTIYFTCSRTFAGSIRDVTMLFCARIKRIRVVNHLHGSDFKSFYFDLPRLYQRIVFFAYSGIDTSIVLIEGMEEQFDIFQSMKKVVVSNSYSKELDSLPTIKESNSNILNLLYLSNIMQSKGIINLLKACDSLFYKYDNIVLNIAGQIQSDSISTFDEIGTTFNLLLNNLQKKYPNRITYFKVLSGEAKTELLWKSDIFILPTFYKTEAFPISILEAMRSGNYIISTNFKYIPQIVLPSNGRLIEPKSISAIIDVFDEIMIDYVGLKSTQNYNINYAIRNFDENRFVADIIKVILQ